MIRSNPPGALVYIDDYEVGTTPCATHFIYYGQRRIRLVKDGYETLTRLESIPPPWYQVPPLDFVTENLVPGEIRDVRELSYNLVPQVVVPPEQLLGRAEDLRRGVHQATGTAPPSIRRTQPDYGPSLPASPEVVAAPPGVGGQPVYPLPPR